MRRPKSEQRVLLLNPPGDKLYIRSNYCSKVSKSNSVHEPIDLVILSGLVAESFPLSVLDCIAEGIDVETAIKKIAELDPQVIITLVGSASWTNDVSFLSRLKESHQAIILASGDELMEGGEEILAAHNFLEAIILDYTSREAVDYIKGRRSGLNHILFRGHGASPYLSKKAIEFEIPVPRHELFPLKRYNFPFRRHFPVASVLTDFGCPYTCAFCIFGQLGFKLRKIENVLEELQYLTSLGVREIVFGDQTFAAERERTIRLAEKMQLFKPLFSWSCYSRADVLDRPLLKLLKRSGCHTIIIGVESGHDHILKKYHKGLTTARIKETIRLCREVGLQTVATFIIGLPGETEEEALETIKFAKGLGGDFASFNTPVPRQRTPLRQEARINKWLIPGKKDMDQSGTDSSLSTPGISAGRLKELRRQAEREFYLRPGFLVKRFLSLRSMTSFLNEIREGIGLIFR